MNKIRLFSVFALLSLLLDGLTVGLSFVLANWIRFHSGWVRVDTITSYSHYRTFIFIVVGIHLVIFKYGGLYRSRRGISGVDEFSKIFRGVLVASILIAASTFLFHFFSFSRLVIGFSAGFSLTGVWLGRLLLRIIQIRLRRRGVGVTRVLIAGTGETAQILLQRLKQNPGLGYRVIGILSEGKAKGRLNGFKIVGGLSDFNRQLARYEPEEVLFALPASAHGKLIPLLVSLQDTGVKYKIVSDLFGIITNPMESDVLLDIPVFEMKEAPLNAVGRRMAKRTLDFALSLSGISILTLIPILPLIALGVKLTSPGPVFFRQKRIGRDGKIFFILKFRSMREGTETVAFTAQQDPRVTPLGAFLRKTSLDELPQLFNVLLGEMSLVGPRPEVPGLVEKFEKTIPRYFERHQVKSGITGWAQVNGFRGNTSLSERVKYDIYYIENWSLWFDIKIILRTVLDILEHQHAY